MKRTLLVTDIHGSFKALLQVLDRSGFNPEVDLLISLGDVCDGWPDVTECVQYLAALPNHQHLLGNHDDWCHRWLRGRLDQSYSGLHFEEFDLWDTQGGRATMVSMDSHGSHQEVFDYLEDASFFIETKSDLLVHGGVPIHSWAGNVPVSTLMWDRTMVGEAVRSGVADDPVVKHYGLVYCGHTPTIMLRDKGSPEPRKFSNVWMLDTGASYDGKLTVFCKETKEFWQSDPVPDLYPGVKAR